jgi:TonB-like protein
VPDAGGGPRGGSRGALAIPAPQPIPAPRPAPAAAPRPTPTPTPAPAAAAPSRLAITGYDRGVPESSGRTGGGAGLGDGPGDSSGDGPGRGLGLGELPALPAPPALPAVPPPPPLPPPAEKPPSKARPPKLIYPARDRQGDEAETFVARLTVDTDGYVVGAHLVRGIGSSRDELASQLVWRFRYAPALDDDGRAIRATIDQRFLVGY